MSSKKAGNGEKNSERLCTHVCELYEREETIMERRGTFEKEADETTIGEEELVEQ